MHGPMKSGFSTGATGAASEKLSQFRAQYNCLSCISQVVFMPISLRLSADVEAQIAGFGARKGLTKSAVIVRSIHEYLAKHAQPSSLEIYESVMLAAAKVEASAVQEHVRREAAEQRPLKRQVREAIRRKQSERSKRATEAIAASHTVVRATAGTRTSRSSPKAL